MTAPTTPWELDEGMPRMVRMCIVMAEARAAARRPRDGERSSRALEQAGGVACGLLMEHVGQQYDVEARAQVGRPYRKTPVFKSKITYLEFNPTWAMAGKSLPLRWCLQDTD